ncbi:MAG: hypothetical protein AAF635_14210 [Cyanobacteria bacterium P01_C01_bin.69]
MTIGRVAYQLLPAPPPPLDPPPKLPLLELDELELLPDELELRVFLGIVYVRSVLFLQEWQTLLTRRLPEDE